MLTAVRGSCCAETDIDAFMAMDIELLRCEVWGAIWQLGANVSTAASFVAHWLLSEG